MPGMKRSQGSLRCAGIFALIGCALNAYAAPVVFENEAEPNHTMPLKSSIFPIFIDKVRTSIGRSKRYTLQGTKWMHKNLTYRINNYPENLNKTDVDNEIARAFAVWSNYTDLKFAIGSGKVDIDISFHRGDHGSNCEPFRGTSQMTAHAFYPGTRFTGDAHFDLSRNWTIRNNSGIDLFQTAVHEFGHSLGLDHSNFQTAAMWPIIRSYSPNYQLDNDDITGIQKIYGTKTEGTKNSTKDQDASHREGILFSVTTESPPPASNKTMSETNKIHVINKHLLLLR
ncbi:72 kDa type IV collagenase-like [Neodiprion virginianus]|uniref:72 kDa type IV collagenase-like n=1 Tax=Neodiprion virginianus TaxID=2961670 RepID=UPI001EE697C1|nr:72 kDa type IV collagenase-like [Neodiprion virginianus]XP_046607142.1 72 kDa type IV collagenase-like [Neodiprion virginianus]